MEKFLKLRYLLLLSLLFVTKFVSESAALGYEWWKI